MKKIFSLAILVSFAVAMPSYAMKTTNNRMPLISKAQKTGDMWNWNKVQDVWERIETKASRALHNIMSAIKGHHNDKQTVMLQEQEIKQLTQAADRKELKKDSPAMKEIDRAEKAVKEAKKQVESVESAVREQLEAAHSKIHDKRKKAQSAVEESIKKLKKATEEVNKA